MHSFVGSKLQNEEEGEVKVHVTNKKLVIELDQNTEGMLLLRQKWTINQIKTEHGRCGSFLFEWHYKNNDWRSRIKYELHKD